MFALTSTSNLKKEKAMRRRASEVIHDLEIRIAHLEREAFLGDSLDSVKRNLVKLFDKIPYMREIIALLKKVSNTRSMKGASTLAKQLVYIYDYDPEYQILEDHIMKTERTLKGRIGLALDMLVSTAELKLARDQSPSEVALRKFTQGVPAILVLAAILQQIYFVVSPMLSGVLLYASATVIFSIITYVLAVGYNKLSDILEPILEGRGSQSKLRTSSGSMSRVAYALEEAIQYHNLEAERLK